MQSLTSSPTHLAGKERKIRKVLKKNLTRVSIVYEEAKDIICLMAHHLSAKIYQEG